MIALTYPRESKRINLAMNRLKEALHHEGFLWKATDHSESADYVSLIKVLVGSNHRTKGILEEGYQIRKTSSSRGKMVVEVIATDESGAMYGVFDVAEQLRSQKKLESISECKTNPRFSFRAIKFNLPWSSYRQNQSFELQKETLKTQEFWERFLDMMVENRFNVLTLWSLHPFPYMIRSKTFPKATPFSDEELAEWKQLWSSIFQMAKDRGIETYLTTWNIFVSESFRENYDSNAVSDETFYHLGEGYSTELIKSYNRECVTQVINEYPNLTGLSTSLGERMEGMSAHERREWVEDVYYQGMKNANRKVKYIYRAPFTLHPEITRDAIEKTDFVHEPIWLELKFNWSHAYSTTKLRMTHGGLSDKLEGYWDPKPTNYKITWMARNEDFFTLRWAQPDFIRDHIRENGHDYVGGYFIGSECFIPGYDYSHKKDSNHVQWDYAFEKHWLYYMLWGRLMYNPDLPNDVFANAIGNKYGQTNGYKLLDAFSSVSKMPMALASSFLTLWDFTLYSEGFLSTDTSGYNAGKSFISLEDLINTRPIESTFLSVSAYVKRENDQDSMEGFVTPIQLADQLKTDSLRGLDLLTKLSVVDSPGLCCEMDDIKSWAYLGLYFSDKLRAAVSYKRFLETDNQMHQQEALYWLDAPNALKHWDDLIEVTSAHYQEQPLMHLGDVPFSWKRFRPQVVEDIEYVHRKGRLQNSIR